MRGHPETIFCSIWTQIAICPHIFKILLGRETYWPPSVEQGLDATEIADLRTRAQAVINAMFQLGTPSILPSKHFIILQGIRLAVNPVMSMVRGQSKPSTLKMRGPSSCYSAIF